MRLLLVVAARNLVQAPRRTLLLGGALALVTMLLVLLLALSQGLSDTLIRAATTLSSGHVNVAGFYKTDPRSVAPLVTEAEEVKRIVREETDGLVDVIDRHRGWAKVVSPTDHFQSGVNGIEPSQEDRLFRELELAPVSAYTDSESGEVEGDLSKLSEPDAALLFAGQAQRLEVRVGDVLTMTTETMDGRTNTRDVRVVAVARNIGFMSNFNVFVNRSVLLDLYRLKPSTTGAIMLYLDDVERAPAVMAELRETLRERGYDVMAHDPRPFFLKLETLAGEEWTGQKLDLTVWRDEVSFLTWVVTALDTISLVLVLLLVGIIALGITNTMWIAVRERTGEIGTLRAIGMGRGSVLALFLVEAMLLGLLGTGVGALAGSAVGVALDAASPELPLEALQAVLLSRRLSLTVAPLQVLAAIGGFTLLTGLAALGPALRAARMQPITAIHRAG